MEKTDLHSAFSSSSLLSIVIPSPLRCCCRCSCLLLLRFVFLLPSPLRNRRRSSALASSPLLAHGSFLLLRDPNGSLFPPRCPHSDPKVLLPCRGGDLPTPRRCRHYFLVAIRCPERLSSPCPAYNILPHHSR